MLKMIIGAFLIAVVLAASNVFAQPSVVFVDPGPGLHAPFASSDAIDAVNNYGRISWVAGFTFDGWSGRPTAPNVAARYETTLKGDPNDLTPMPVLEDWVLEITYGLTPNTETAGDFVFFAKAKDSTPQEARIVSLVRDSNNHVTLKAGDAQGGWFDVAPPIDMTPDPNGGPPTTWITFTVHYKAATSTMDAYADSTQIGSDFTLGHGDYAVEFIQMQTSDNNHLGIDSFRQIKIGQSGIVIPPDPVCGDVDHPVPDADLSQPPDCMVNLEDFALFAVNWMVCTQVACD